MSSDTRLVVSFWWDTYSGAAVCSSLSLWITEHFEEYAESIPGGDTSRALSEAAKKFATYVVGGTIPERDNGSLYNTATVWDPQGNLIAKHRKVRKKENSWCSDSCIESVLLE